jgi:hypothetical protein
MFPGLSPRLFGAFKEGGIITAKFTVGGGGAAGITFTLKSVNAAGAKLTNYGGLSMARSAVGVGTVTLKPQGNVQGQAPGVRDLQVLALEHVPATPGSVANYFELRFANINEANGTFDFRPNVTAGTAFAEFAMANGDEIHVTLYVNR